MPFPMCCYIQSVLISENIFVGGGFADTMLNYYTVMVYAVPSAKWKKLPRYSARNFALTNIRDELALVGGEHEGLVRHVGVWKVDPKKWTYPFPSMPTPCIMSSAISHKDWLVVAGGTHKDHDLTLVQILDCVNKQWSNGPYLPKPVCVMKSTKINNTWYLMGGCSDYGVTLTDVFSLSLDALFSRNASGSNSFASSGNSAWKELPHLSTTFSYPIGVGDSLFAVGGKDKTGKEVSIIQRYDPETKAWVLAGHLPQPYWTINCIKTKEEVFFIGGSSKLGKLKRVYHINLKH